MLLREWKKKDSCKKEMNSYECDDVMISYMLLTPFQPAVHRKVAAAQY
jgi:hypothetical protein